MKTTQQLVVITVSFLLAIATTSCTTQPKRTNAQFPMHASLDGMTAEASPTEVHQALPDSVKLMLLPHTLLGFQFYESWRWSQRSVISISGGLAMPRVGDAYYWEEKKPLVTALRVFSAPSVSWVQQTIEGPPDTNTLFNAKRLLESIQADTARTLQLALELAALKSSSAAPRIQAIEEKVDVLQGRILTNSERLSTVLSQSGVISFRWAKKHDSEDSVTADDYGSVSRKSKGRETGIALAAGLRFASLNPEGDWDANYDIIRKSLGYKRASQVGVVTYLMQCRDIVYIRDVEALQDIRASANLSKLVKDIAGGKAPTETIEKLKLVFELYRSTESKIGAFGGAAGAQWETIRVAAGQIDPSQSVDGYATIHAVLTDPKALTSKRPQTPPIEVRWLGKSLDLPPYPQRLLSNASSRVSLMLECSSKGTVGNCDALAMAVRGHPLVSRRIKGHGDASMYALIGKMEIAFGITMKAERDLFLKAAAVDFRVEAVANSWLKEHSELLHTLSLRLRELEAKVLPNED